MLSASQSLMLLILQDLSALDLLMKVQLLLSTMASSDVQTLMRKIQELLPSLILATQNSL